MHQLNSVTTTRMCAQKWVQYFAAWRIRAAYGFLDRVNRLRLISISESHCFCTPRTNQFLGLDISGEFLYAGPTKLKPADLDRVANTSVTSFGDAAAKRREKTIVVISSVMGP